MIYAIVSPFRLYKDRRQGGLAQAPSALDQGTCLRPAEFVVKQKSFSCILYRQAAFSAGHDQGGSFNVTNPISASAPQNFYLLQLS